MRATRALLVAALLAVAAWTPARAAGPTFGTPTAESPLAGPSVFHTTIASDTQPQNVELLLNFPGQAFTNVVSATVSGGNGQWTAEATDADHILPNSLLHYQFRMTDASGAVVLGPQAQILTVDDRFQWKQVAGPVVRLHWNGGDSTFGQTALDIGEKAIANASKLLGVTETDPIDFFIYDDEKAFRDALGPGTRENVAGTAIPEIRTMFAYVLPSDIGNDWVRVLVTHELTHLVFDTATANIYHHPSHWLNEGIAVYLSEGFSARWQGDLAVAEADATLIPLQGMNTDFGAGDTRFELGYAEAVSAIDYFVRTHTQDKLWALVRSYSTGLSDDDAFKQAIGVDVAGFNDAWMKSLGVAVPAERGPRPGPVGPLPPEWTGHAPASPGTTRPGTTSPGATGSGSIGGTRPTVRPTTPGSGGGSSSAGKVPPADPGLIVLGVAVIAVVAVWLFITIRRRRQPAPAEWWQGPPGYDPSGTVPPPWAPRPPGPPPGTGPPPDSGPPPPSWGP